MLLPEIFELILEFSSSKTRAQLCSVNKWFSITCPTVSKRLSRCGNLYDKDPIYHEDIYCMMLYKDYHLFVRSHTAVQSFVDNWDIYQGKNIMHTGVTLICCIICYAEKNEIPIHYGHAFAIACRKRHSLIIKKLYNKVSYCQECFQPLTDHLKLKHEFDEIMNKAFSIRRNGFIDC